MKRITVIADAKAAAWSAGFVLVGDRAQIHDTELGGRRCARFWGVHVGITSVVAVLDFKHFVDIRGGGLSAGTCRIQKLEDVVVIRDAAARDNPG